MPPLFPCRLLLIAAVEGLLLTPLHTDNCPKVTTPTSRPSSPDPRSASSRNSSPSLSSLSNAGTIQIEYKTSAIKPLFGRMAEYKKRDREAGMEIYGIAGLLNVSPQNSYLIAITQRQQVALLNRVPVYVITDVALIPLQSQTQAQAALSKAKALRNNLANGIEFGLDADTDASDSEGALEDIDQTDKKPAVAAVAEKEDTIGRSGVYGMFAQRWFSKRGWSAAAYRRSGTERESAQGTDSAKFDESEPGNQDVFEQVNPKDAALKIYTDGAADTKVGNLPARQKDSGGQELLNSESENEATREEQVAAASESVAHSLTPKLLRTTRLLLASSRSFFFSYDFDITRNWLQQQGLRNADSEAPLWTRVDPVYFWNKHLIRPFSDASLHAFILPLMQGFISQRTFYATVSPLEPPEPTQDGSPSTGASPKDIDAKGPTSVTLKQPFIFTLISRRSTKRAGLRYLRRGVDSQGNVANYVETEQLLSIPSLNNPESPEWLRTYSYVQIRGSIPLYFQQSPYALRPKPVLLNSEETNKIAFKKHFDQVRETYEDVFCVTLVERGSAEKIVGEKYEKYVAEFNEAPQQGYRIGFEWFDFHKVCKGMRFEKVSVLLDDCQDVLNRFGWTEVNEGTGEVARKQEGVMRTNCMDCLDRTNVVESAFARNALDKQLQKEHVSLSSDPTEWFNILWADNGDAISKQYASTAALKGDFTRTRKRNYRGALTDLGLTMSRYFTNIISDFFTQAAIDFLLGNVTNRVFDEFEADMMSSDPAVSMAEIRRNAIDISAKIVIADDSNNNNNEQEQVQENEQEQEVLVKGWTFLAPYEDNTLRTFPFKENVLLLTNKALYSCRFDFAMEKVNAFERIDLRHVEGVQIGTYITSTLASSSTDEGLNVGFVIRYQPGKNDFLRVNTGSLRSEFSQEQQEEEADGEENGEGHANKEQDIKHPSAVESQFKNVPEVIEKPVKGTGTRLIAFKALPRGCAISKDSPEIGVDEPASPMSLREEVRDVAELIAKVSLEASKTPEEALRGVERERGGSRSFFWEDDIISLKDAKKKTGLLEQLGYNLRRFVWG